MSPFGNLFKKFSVYKWCVQKKSKTFEVTSINSTPFK